MIQVFELSRRKLKHLPHKLRIYIEHQQATGALGYIPASSEERAEFEAQLATRAQRELRDLTAALHAPGPGARRTPTASTPQKPSQPPAPTSSHVAPPSFSPGGEKKKAPAPPPVSSGGGALWKQLGARPENILKKQSKPPTPPPPEPPPEHQPAPPQREPAKPAFKEVRRRDDRPPSKRPQPRQSPSLFGAEFDRKTTPIAGFDASPDQVKRLEHMTNYEKLSFLRECLGDCTRCKLAQTRSNIVFGDGDPNADIVFVGEGPGYNEDKQGLPFVGKAGQLLNRMIFAMGIEREDVYIANVVKCRPPNNRDPAPDEIARCSPYLYKQLETINPKVIVTLGRFASQCLLDTRRSMGSMRGRWQDWRGVEVMPTYHPAFLLRNPESKRQAWNDLKMVMDKLDLKGR